MTDSTDRHQAQVEFWNGAGGAKWLDQQTRTDAMLAPVADALLAAADIRPGARVLDIGCGCGATVLALATRVGPVGRVLGIDVSAPMLARARERAAGLDQVELRAADAAAHRFEPASMDRLVSRFGVMFFGDPVAAFANLLQALKPDGRLVFACWRSLDENPWMKVPLKAAYAHVPPLPRPGPEDPGPFSFADPERVRRILAAAGFRAPALTPVDLALDLANGDGLDGAMAQVAQIGAASRALAEQPADVREAAFAEIRAALAPYASGASVRLPAAIWIVDSAPA